MRNSASVRLRSIHQLCVIVRTEGYKSKTHLLITKNLGFTCDDPAEQKHHVYAPTHYYALFDLAGQNRDRKQALFRSEFFGYFRSALHGELKNCFISS